MDVDPHDFPIVVIGNKVDLTHGLPMDGVNGVEKSRVLKWCEMQVRYDAIRFLPVKKRSAVRFTWWNMVLIDSAIYANAFLFMYVRTEEQYIWVWACSSF